MAPRSENVGGTDKLLIMIDDAEGGEFLGNEILQEISRRYDIRDCKLLFLLPQKLKFTRELHADSRPVETAIEIQPGQVAACIVDCDLGSVVGRDFSWTLELCRRLKRGLPPFGKSLRDMPIALYTGSEADYDYYKEVAPPDLDIFFMYKGGGHYSSDLARWIARQLQAVGENPS